jgi:ribosomal protein S18 acetylase RimI-like enzyme
MRAEDFLSEIERLSPSGFEGGKKYLDSYSRQKTVRKLPGGSGLLYSIINDSGDFIIRLWDQANKGEFQGAPVSTERPPYYTRREWASRIEYINQRNARRKAEFDAAPGKLVGELTVNDVSHYFPMKGALQVRTITVDEDYRGVGLAKALYGIVLTIMKRPLLAGSSQTPGGRRNWMSLSQIPGVEMKGYFRMDDDEFEYANANKKIDIIMGQLGGQHIGKSRSSRHYFAFDVQPNTTKKELQAYVDTSLSRVYGDTYSNTGLFAVWTGQQ